MKGFYNIQVFDDLFSSFQEDYFYHLIFGKEEEKILPLVDFRIKYEPTAFEKDFKPISFMHVLKSNPVKSAHLENFSCIPQVVCDKLNTKLKNILYGRIFLTIPYPTTKKHADPHTDLSSPHWVVLYYVNDSDGETVFFDSKKNIVDTVQPKKGRCVVFNGEILHAAGIPKNNPRCVVNFDIII